MSGSDASSALRQRAPASLLTALLVACAAPTAAQARPDRVDSLIAAEMQRQNIPGLSLAVLRNGEIVKAQGYGVAERAHRTPATPETVYKIASVSKQFIATGIMFLVQDRRLNPPHGFGWELGSLNGHRLVHHGGGMTGFGAWFARFVDDGLTVIVLMNLDDVDPVTIVNGVARLYLTP